MLAQEVIFNGSDPKGLAELERSFWRYYEKRHREWLDKKAAKVPSIPLLAKFLSQVAGVMSLGDYFSWQLTQFGNPATEYIVMEELLMAASELRYTFDRVEDIPIADIITRRLTAEHDAFRKAERLRLFTREPRPR